MRYLAFFEALKDKLSKEPNLVQPTSGWHCTLCRFDTNERDEAKLVNKLSELECKAFTTHVKDHEIWGKMHVITLGKPQELQNLHESIISLVRPFYDNPVEFRSVTQYGLERYNPHITLSKDSFVADLDEDYLKLSAQVSKYSLAKKKGGLWRIVSEFSLE